MLARLIHRTPPVWALILLSLAAWGTEYARRGLWEPDEARYAQVAREMRAGGNWFVPHLDGKPYPDKPPLMFWLMQAGSTVTGGRINHLSARLPSFLGVVLTLWVISRLLTNWCDPPAAWRGVFVALTTFLFWQEGGWAQIDALLCGLIMVSVYFFWRSLDGSKITRELLAYIFAGLAILAKGPVGLVLPMIIFAAGTMAMGYGRKLRRSHWLWGPLVSVLIPAAWLVVAYLHNPPAEYFQEMFGTKSFGRVIEARDHIRPLYYYLWHFPLESLPWALFIPAIYVAMSDRLLKRSLFAWILAVIGFFSLISCKRNIYILTAYPALAMLVAAAWKDISRSPGKLAVGAAWICTSLIWLMAVILGVALFLPQLPISPVHVVPSVLVLIVGGIWIVNVLRRKGLSDQWLAAFTITLILAQVTISGLIFPAANQIKAPIKEVKAINSELGSDDPIYMYRQQLAIVPLYAHRYAREINSLSELPESASGTPSIVIFKAHDWKELSASLNAHVEAHPFTMAEKHLVWVRFSHAPKTCHKVLHS